MFGSCYEKGIEDVKYEIMEAKRKEGSGIKKEEKNDDNDETIGIKKMFKRIADMSKETKGTTKKVHFEIIEVSYTSDHYRKKIRVERIRIIVFEEKEEKRKFYLNKP
ncbi:hypothetical protein F8M41_025215 [Gigaspora margarita]|uniref:Uncharacterized protein n=1 Tax=Gigaspora margarita TaxID=4874 RepID=A0A8H4B0C6_GIGMA|nr:hypothetical protein F8M41_025215 [Gigaspora margarita]